MSDDIRMEGPGDFGDHTEVRLTRPVKNVPVKHNGKTIGVADIDEDGMVHATFNSAELDIVTRRRLLGPMGEFSIRPNTNAPKNDGRGRTW